MSNHSPFSQTQAQTRKPIFDLVRKLIGRRFRQSEVDALDDALDTGPKGARNGGIDGGEGFSPLDSVSSVSNTAVKPSKETKKSRNSNTIGTDGIALIKRFEGCAQQRRDGLIEAYPDPGTGAEPWTIGWGATGLIDKNDPKDGERIGPGTVWTQEQCDARFASDLKAYAAEVARAIGETPTTQNQFDALVSFHYNTGAIARATLTRKHNARDYDGAAAEFARWNKAGGRVLKGLVNRRREEAALYARDARGG